MLAAIYAVVSLQAIILVLVLYLVLRRWTANLLGRYAEERKRRFEPHVLNLLNDPTATEPLQQGLRLGDKHFIKELLLEQASQLKGSDRLSMTGVFEKLGYVNRELNVLSSGGTWWRRLEAAIDLGIMRSRSAASALIDAVRDPEDDVRLAAVRALGELNEPRGLGILLDSMEEGVHWPRNSVAEVVAGLGPGVAPEITARLESTSNIEARLLYVHLCGLLRISTVVGLLVSLLRDPDKNIRMAAAQALGQLGDESAVPGLLTALDDDIPEVRAQSAKAMGNLGDKQAVAKLKRALSDEHWQVRHNAAESLYRLGREGSAALHEASCSHPPPACLAASQILAEKALGI